jgi:hypothetical protein
LPPFLAIARPAPTETAPFTREASA